MNSNEGAQTGRIDEVIKRRKAVLELSSIEAEQSLQARVKMDDATLEEYAGKMKFRRQQVVDLEQKAWPDLDVFDDGERLWLADGFHRYAAARKAGIKKMQADIRPGTRRDALLYALKANAKHGLKRTNEDKRNAVRIALLDDEWRKRTNKQIATMCAVSPPTVAKERARLEERGTILAATTRITLDGGTIDMRQVGKGRPKAAPAPEATPAVGPTIRRRDGTVEHAGDTLPIRPVTREVASAPVSRPAPQEFVVRDGELEEVEPAPRRRTVHYILDAARADYANAARKVLIEGDVLVCLWPRVRELRPFGVMLDGCGAEAWADVEIEEMDCVVVSRHPVDGVRPTYEDMEAARTQLQEDINGAR